MFSYIKLIHKIGRKDTPSAHFVVINLKLLFIYFVNVIKFKPIWQEFQNFINTKICHSDYDFNNFDKLFGFPQERWLTYLLCVVNFIFTVVNFKLTPQALGLLNLFLLLNVIWNIIWLRKMVNCSFILKSGV